VRLPPPALPPASEIERAARLLSVRGRRQASGAFAGEYRSAFRGGGVEFEESRPYVPGDDVRSLDWNALARTGVPHVKRFREERDQTLMLALDVSASMAFGSGGRSKVATAAHAAALLAAAASRAGDRLGLVAFDAAVRARVAPARGEAQLWRVLRSLAAEAARPGGRTDLVGSLAELRGAGGPWAGRRWVVVVLSDFRDERLLGDGAGRGSLAALARAHDLVAGIVQDPREEEIPAVGAIRLADPERPGRSLLLRSGSPRGRALYVEAALRRRRAVEVRLRQGGADALWLRTDRDPLGALARFFARRAGAGPEARTRARRGAVGGRA
jgi:uncharacterized protein (DUF58 family)